MNLEPYYNSPALPLSVSAGQRPAFTANSYEEVVNHLTFYYNQLVDFMRRPAVVHYADLAALRQRAISPNLNDPTHNRTRAQLTLAAELLRLGRRREGIELLAELEKRLLESSNPARNIGLLVWSALLRAAARDQAGAFYLAFQITAQRTSPELDVQLANFFGSLHRPAASIRAD